MMNCTTVSEIRMELMLNIKTGRTGLPAGGNAGRGCRIGMGYRCMKDRRQQSAPARTGAQAGPAKRGGTNQAVAAVGRFSGMGMCRAAAAKPSAMEPYHTQS